MRPCCRVVGFLFYSISRSLRFLPILFSLEYRMDRSASIYPFIDLGKGFLNKDVKLNISNKVTTLNPDAAEFVPSALRSTFGSINSADQTRLNVPGPSGKAVLDRSESSVSNSSDDEALKYWCHQLPDDITPDFKVMGEDELQTPEQLSLAALSIHDGIESSRFSASFASHLSNTRQDIYVHSLDNLKLTEKTGHSGTTFAKDQPSAALMTLATNNWDKQFINGDHQFPKGREGHNYKVDSRVSFSNSSSSEHAVLENTTINPLEFLASQFPSFAAKNLADVYYSNGCDLNATIKMLTQLELQVDVNFSQSMNSKSLSAPSLSMLDFVALPMVEPNNGEDLQVLNPYTSPTLSRGTIDFPSIVRRLTSQDSERFKYDRNGPVDFSVGLSRISQPIESSYNGNDKSFLRDKLQNFGAPRAVPAWIESGETAAAHTYSESREGARNIAHLQNVCLEQAKQAYLIGNSALAKEPSTKGNLFGLQMKATHGKAKETVYLQRNPSALEVQGYIRGQNPLIDLHGLHASEAIHVLKHELSILRSTARTSGQRLQVMICVGMSHHTRSTGTPGRLLIAVEQYLLEEGFPCTQPQPGLLRVVIY